MKTGYEQIQDGRTASKCCGRQPNLAASFRSVLSCLSLFKALTVKTNTSTRLQETTTLDGCC